MNNIKRCCSKLPKFVGGVNIDRICFIEKKTENKITLHFDKTVPHLRELEITNPTIIKLFDNLNKMEDIKE